MRVVVSAWLTPCFQLHSSLLLERTKMRGKYGRRRAQATSSLKFESVTLFNVNLD